MYNIVLDTNFLLIPIKFKVDIFREIERICDFPYNLHIVDKTIDELKGKKGEKLALSLIKHHNINIIKTNKDKIADDLITDLKLENKVIATQDKDLKKRNKPYIITLKQKTHLIKCFTKQP